jgi:hypothetical protein
MNWGYKLTLVFIAFAAMIGTLVYKATHTRFELVSKDYYNEELRYQEKIDGMNNAGKAGELGLVQYEHSIELQLPASLLNKADSVQAWFYCKSNANADRKMLIAFTNGNATVAMDGFAKTDYELKLQFNADHKPYYYTKTIDLR